MKTNSSQLSLRWTNTTAVRLAVTAVIVVAIYAACLAAGSRRASAKVEMPRWNIDAIPLALGAWQGEAASLDPRLFLAVGAATAGDIAYRNALGQQVSMHCAVFDKETSGLPHHPKLCYESNGYKLLSDKSIRLRRGDQTTIPASLLTWERKDDRVALLFWYQMGNRVLTESSEMAAARWATRRGGGRPALCKFMLQTSLDNPESAQTRLREVAGLLLEWMSQAEKTPSANN